MSLKMALQLKCFSYLVNSCSLPVNQSSEVQEGIFNMLARLNKTLSNHIDFNNYFFFIQIYAVRNCANNTITLQH